MLDEISGELLAALDALLEGGGFKIVEESELSALPFGADELGRAFSRLEAKGFVELRYADEGAYCVRILPAGRGYAEREALERRMRKRQKRELFLSSALGAFCGGALVSLFALVLSLVM